MIKKRINMVKKSNFVLALNLKLLTFNQILAFNGGKEWEK